MLVPVAPAAVPRLVAVVAVLLLVRVKIYGSRDGLRQGRGEALSDVAHALVGGGGPDGHAVLFLAALEVGPGDEVAVLCEGLAYEGHEGLEPGLVQLLRAVLARD